MLASKENIYHCLIIKPIITNRKKSETGHNSISSVWNLFTIYSGHLHLEHKLGGKYHDPSSWGSPYDFVHDVPFG